MKNSLSYSSKFDFDRLILILYAAASWKVMHVRNTGVIRMRMNFEWKKKNNVYIYIWKHMCDDVYVTFKFLVHLFTIEI